MRFWDTSALVPLCIREPQTPVVQGLLDEDPGVAVWWAARTECVSAFARSMRGGGLQPDAVRRARERLNRRETEWLEVPPTETLRTTAERLVSIHPLRAADAFQLAAALHWCGDRPAGAGFISFDSRLREAAWREGFLVLPERV